MEELKEYIVKNRESYSAAIAGNEVQSLRKRQKTESTVRVYKDGLIGIGGAVGKTSEKELTDKANAALRLGIEYPCCLTENVQADVRKHNNVLPADKVLETSVKLTERLKKEFPTFIISASQMELIVSDKTYTNSRNTTLKSDYCAFNVALCAKEVSSANIMDVFHYDVFTDKFGAEEEQTVIDNMHMICDNYYKQATLPDGKYTIMYETAEMFGTFLDQHLQARSYAQGNSILKGKLGQKVFADGLSVYCDRTIISERSIFDDEGSISENNVDYLIKDGVLTGLITNKKLAEEFGLQNTHCAAAPYDDTPVSEIIYDQLIVKSQYTVAAAKPLDRFIWVQIVSGADSTPQGDIACPVMLSYLVENGKVVGRLPQLTFSGNIIDIFGKDLVGIGDTSPLINSKNTQPIFVNVDVVIDK
ncbi:MAG: metallopeptidase TldD-related protein [Clostridia bacterium]|nr:metallopeptidase TldD-related protein [Clostridia bacterium]